MDKKYLSMAQAAEVSPYEQDYLSLLARRGELKAEKIGRNWYTTIEWLNEYLKEKKPSDIILPREKMGEKIPRNIAKRQKNIFQIVLVWVIFTVLFAVVGFFIFDKINKKLEGIEEKTDVNKFVPDEITRVPNENGGVDVYGTGRMKISN